MKKFLALGFMAMMSVQVASAAEYYQCDGTSLSNKPVSFAVSLDGKAGDYQEVVSVKNLKTGAMDMDLNVYSDFRQDGTGYVNLSSSTGYNYIVLSYHRGDLSIQLGNTSYRNSARTYDIDVKTATCVKSPVELVKQD